MRQEVIEIALTSAGPYAPRSRQITMPAPHHSNLYTPDGCSLWCRTNSVKPLKATGCWFVHLLTPAACLMVWILLNKLLLFIHSLVMMKLEAMICHTLVIQLWQCGGRLLSVKVVCVFRLARLVWRLYVCSAWQDSYEGSLSFGDMWPSTVLWRDYLLTHEWEEADVVLSSVWPPCRLQQAHHWWVR